MPYGNAVRTERLNLPRSQSCRPRRYSVYHDRSLGVPMLSRLCGANLPRARPGHSIADCAFAPEADEEAWMGDVACRACREQTGHLVLDLGEQPACDYFPPCDDPGPDPVYPLQMWLCSSCGLAQLAADATVPEEPRGAEPIALVAQAADAVQRVATAGLLPAA